MDNYVDKAIDEVYDILLYNPTYIDKSTKKRLERLYVAKQQLIENPKESKELMEKIK